jgi:hypothetical protein
MTKVVSPKSADFMLRLDLKAQQERWIDVYDKRGNYYATIKVQEDRVTIYHSPAVQVRTQKIE